jgi:hypothetical protein
VSLLFPKIQILRLENFLWQINMLLWTFLDQKNYHLRDKRIKEFKPSSNLDQKNWLLENLQTKKSGILTEIQTMVLWTREAQKSLILGNKKTTMQFFHSSKLDFSLLLSARFGQFFEKVRVRVQVKWQLHAWKKKKANCHFFAGMMLENSITRKKLKTRTAFFRSARK